MYQIPKGYGIFVRNTSYHFADLLVNGMKTVETRRSRTLDSCIGKWVTVVKTETRTAIGMIYISGVKKYATLEEYEQDFPEHLVLPSSPFRWNGEGDCYGYQVMKSKLFLFPIRIPKTAKRYGRIAVDIIAD